MSTLAIDIGGTKFSMAVFEGERIVERTSHASDKSILDRIAIIIDKWKPHYSFDRCGIGFGGPVDFERQRVILSTHVSGWDNFDFPHHIEKLIGVLPVIDNDANAGALGEALYGAGRDYRPLCYMTLSTGIGGGIITSGDAHLPRR